MVERRRVQFEKKKRDEEYIVEKMKDKKSDWRCELKEQPVFKAVPIDTGKMTSSQSFAVFTNFGGDDSDTGLRFSTDGGLGGTESLPIFNFPLEAGGTVPAIDFSTPGGSGTAQINLGDFPLSGYAMPLGGEMYRSITQRKKEEINKELDSSEEYTKQIKADALMKARVGDSPSVVKIYKASDFTPGEGLADSYSPEQLQKLSVQNPQKFSEYKHISDIADEMTKKVETSFEKIDQEYSDQWEPKLSSLLPSNQYSDLYKKHGGSAFNEVDIEINRLYYEEQKAMTRVKTKDGIKLRSNKKSRAIRATANKISDAIPTLQELQNKLDDIRQSKMDVVVAENRREMKALQKAAPKFFLPNGELKPLPMYMEPFGADLKTMSDIEKYASEPVKDENPKGFLDLISDPAAKLMGYAPAKNAFDYYMNQLKSQNVPLGEEIKGEHNLTNMMDKKEMNLMKTMIDGVMADPTLTTDIQREVELNKGYLNVRAASKNFKNITGFFDPTKNDGFKIDRGKDGVIKNIKIKKSYDFTDKGDTGGANIVSGLSAMSYAGFSGLNKYFKGGSESPTMNLEIDFGIPTISKTKSKRKYDEYGRLKESSSYKRIFNKIKISNNTY